MNREKKIQAARRLLTLAKELTAVDGEEDVDEAFAGRIRTLRSKLNKLTQKKRRKLNQYGIGILRPNSTVEDLVGALEQVLAEA